MKHFVDTFVRGTHKETATEKKQLDNEEKKQLNRISDKVYPKSENVIEEVHDMLAPDTSTTNIRKLENEIDGDESEYFIVKNDGERGGARNQQQEEEEPQAAIPTMNQKFQVK
jgi:hypothetical protein